MMRRLCAFQLTAIWMVLLATTVYGQEFAPKAIHFDGAPGYSDAELRNAGGLVEGHSYTADELTQHAQQLMETGLFDKVGYKFEGETLNYSLEMSAQTYPIVLGNLPLEAGNDLDAKLHERVPLYHGTVPVEGTLLGAVIKAFEDMLASEGVHAQVAATASTTAGSSTIVALKFDVQAPTEVRIGTIRLEGVSYGIKTQIEAITAHDTDLYDTENSSGELERKIAVVYASHGFAAAEVHAVPAGRPVMHEGAIRVPFKVTVKEGRPYGLGKVQISPDFPIDKGEFDALMATRADYMPESKFVDSLTSQVEQKVKERGYLDCKITARPQYDDAAGTVNYTIDGDLGPVYRLAFVKFVGASDNLHTLLMKDWQMLPGDPFDETYPPSFMIKAQHGPPELQQALAGLKATYDVHPDPASHEVNLSIKLEKQ
jgi:outer membrane protein assembly factor BamA